MRQQAYLDRQAEKMTRQGSVPAVSRGKKDEVDWQRVAAAADAALATRSGLMQKVLFPRYDHSRPTVITSNIPWKHWGDYLDDHLGAAAIIDRLIHRSHIIVIEGPSWRDREHKRQVAERKKRKKVAK